MVCFFWCGPTVVVLALTLSGETCSPPIYAPCLPQRSLPRDSHLKTDARRSILALYYPNWHFSSSVRWIVPLECRPCGAPVKTDPKRWRETHGDSGKGERLAQIYFFQCQRWTSTSPNISCFFQASWEENNYSKLCQAKKVRRVGLGTT